MIYFICEFEGMFSLKFFLISPFPRDIIELIDLTQVYECIFFQNRQAWKHDIVIGNYNTTSAAKFNSVEISTCLLVYANCQALAYVHE